MRHSHVVFLIFLLICFVAISHFALKTAQVGVERVACIERLMNVTQGDAQLRLMSGLNAEHQLDLKKRVEDESELIADVREALHPVYQTRFAEILEVGKSVPEVPETWNPGPPSHTWFRVGAILGHAVERKVDDPSWYVLWALALSTFVVYRAIRTLELAGGTIVATNIARGLGIGGPMAIVAIWTYLFSSYASGETFFYTNDQLIAFQGHRGIKLIQTVEGWSNVVAIVLGCVFVLPLAIGCVHGIRAGMKTATTDKDKLLLSASFVYSSLVGPLLLIAVVLSFVAGFVLDGLVRGFDLFGMSSGFVKVPGLVLYMAPFLALMFYAICMLRPCLRIRFFEGTTGVSVIERLMPRHVAEIWLKTRTSKLGRLVAGIVLALMTIAGAYARVPVLVPLVVFGLWLLGASQHVRLFGACWPQSCPAGHKNACRF